MIPVTVRILVQGYSIGKKDLKKQLIKKNCFNKILYSMIYMFVYGGNCCIINFNGCYLEILHITYL